MKTLKYCLIFLACFSCSQKNRCDVSFFAFQVEQRNYIDEWEYEGIGNEYYVIQQHFNNGLLIQTRVFNLDAEAFIETDTFKISDYNWEYLKNGVFYPFLGMKSIKNKQVVKQKIDESSCFEFYPERFVVDSSLLIYRKKYITTWTDETVGTVSFNLERGIIKQKIGGIGYVLNDITDNKIIDKLEAVSTHFEHRKNAQRLEGK